MNLNEFIKPTIGKIILTITLFIVITYLFQYLIITYDATLIGFPSAFYTSSCGFKGTENCESFKIINFILDIAFWYLISCILISLIKKVK